MKNGGIIDLLHETVQVVEPEVKKYLRFEDRLLQEMLLYTFEAGGKRIRPLLVRLGCESVGGDFSRILPAAVSVELLHTFTLVLDDIFDDAIQRRGRDSLHVKYGIENAIIVGNLLKSFAIDAIINIDRSANVNSDALLRSVGIIESTYRTLHMGEYLDLQYERESHITEYQYISMIDKTVASLVRASLHLGAIFGGGDTEQTKALLDYGLHLGRAFQIRNDIADMLGDEEEMGRKRGEDVRQGKNSLPIVYALSKEGKTNKARLRDLLGKRNLSEEEISTAIRLVIDSGAISYATRRVHSFCEEAKESILCLPITDAKNSLMELADIVCSFQ